MTHTELVEQQDEFDVRAMMDLNKNSKNFPDFEPDPPENQN